MRKTAKGLIAELLGAVSLCATLPVLAQAPLPPAARNSCFYANEFQAWKAPDARTIYVRVNLHQYYRLDLASECASLLWPDTHLITHVRGSNAYCSAVDWDLQVAQGFHGAAEPCLVETMTELSPAEAAAIPAKFRP